MSPLTQGVSPVDSGGWLVPWIIRNPDVTLMELHGDRLVVAIIEQNTVFLCSGHLKHTQTRKDTPVRVSLCVCYR